MTDEIPDPITPLREAAASVKELFDEYVRAGFSPDQALELVKVMLTRMGT